MTTDRSEDSEDEAPVVHQLDQQQLDEEPEGDTIEPAGYWTPERKAAAKPAPMPRPVPKPRPPTQPSPMAGSRLGNGQDHIR